MPGIIWPLERIDQCLAQKENDGINLNITLKE